MPQSPIRKLVPLADRAKERGVKVYHLNIGQPDLKTPKVALEAIKNIDRDILEYSPSDGYKSLRVKLAEYYHRFNINVDYKDIIVTTGGSEAVNFAFMACLDPGDEIIVPEPAYANYTAFAISCGAIIKPVLSTIDDGFALGQVNAYSLLEFKPRRATVKLIKDGFVSFVASDCHSSDEIPPRISEALRRIEKKCGKQKLEEIVANSQNLYNKIKGND